MKRYSEHVGLFTGGMNCTDAPFLLPASESPLLQNLTLRGGALRSRRGKAQIASAPTGVLSCAPFLFHGWMLLHVQDRIRACKLAETDDGVPVGSNQAPYADPDFPHVPGVWFQYRGDVYYKTKGAYLRISLDGTTLRGTLLRDEDASTKVYIPTIQLNTDPETGAGERYQPENRFGAGRKVCFNARAGVTDYQLPEREIDRVTMVKVDGTFTVDYTVDEAAGVVSFFTAPPVSDPPVNNTVEIWYRKANPDAYQSVLDCTAAAVFGGAQELCVVLGGCAAQPNAYFWSGNNGLVMDPTYFPMDQYNLAGDADAPITAFGRQQNMLVIFQPNALGRASFGMTEVGGLTKITLDYTRISAAVGCDLPSSVQLVGNNLVWASRRHGVCRLRGTSAAGENNVQILSRKIHGEPGRPGLLRALADAQAQHVRSVNTGRRYLLVLGDSAWEWNHECSAPENPAWFYHTGLRCVGFVPEAGERLFTVSVDGRISEFVNSFADHDEAIEKICELPLRTLGSYHRFKAICGVLFTTCGDAPMDTRVTWSCDFFSREDPTHLTVTIPAGQEPNRALPAVFRRNPGFHSLRHLSARLYNNTAGEDLSFVSAQIIYEYRGRQR